MAAAIKSIVNQTYSNFELILINNNSTDTSLGIANNIEDPRIKILNEPVQGIVHALNKGCHYASGSFIARMDADDISLPIRIEEQVNFLVNNPEFSLVAGQARHISDFEDHTGFKRYVDWSNSIITHYEIQNYMFVESPLIHPTVMWRKEVGEQHGLYKGGDFPEDYELWLRWLYAGVKMHKLPFEVLQWHDHPGRLTRTHANYSDEAFYKIKTDYLARWLEKINPHHPEVFIWGASKISRKRVKLLSNYDIKVKAYIDVKNTRQLDVPVINYRNLPKKDQAFILVYMKHVRIRNEIQQFLKTAGYLEGEHYLLVS